MLVVTTTCAYNLGTISGPNVSCDFKGSTVDTGTGTNIVPVLSTRCHRTSKPYPALACQDRSVAATFPIASDM